MFSGTLFKSHLFLQLLWEVVREGSDMSILHMKKLRLALKKGVTGGGAGQLMNKIEPPSHYPYQLRYIQKNKTEPRCCSTML